MGMHTLATVIVRGIRNPVKRNAVFRYLDSNKIDICCLQETFCTEEFETEYSNGWNGEVFHSFSDSPHCKGVCVMFSKRLNYEVLDTHTDNEGRIIVVNVRINNVIYSIVCVYFPNQEENRFLLFNKLDNFIETYCQTKSEIICSGDFNCTPSLVDRKFPNNDKSPIKLNEFLEQNGLIDLWRKKNTNKVQYTYIDPSNRQHHSRIDLILTSNIVLDKCDSCYISPAPVPDHRAVIMKVNNSVKKRGSGYWKLNTSVLNENDYVNGVEKLIEKTIDDYIEVGSKLTWELCKVRIKDFSIKYCTLRSNK